MFETCRRLEIWFLELGGLGDWILKALSLQFVGIKALKEFGGEDFQCVVETIYKVLETAVENW